MPEPKTEYNPDNYNRDSFANIMQFITADLMIKHEIEGAEAFAEFQPQIVKIRQHIQKAYSAQIIRRPEDRRAVQLIAEMVLLWLREGATVEDVLKASRQQMLKRANAMVRK